MSAAQESDIPKLRITQSSPEVERAFDELDADSDHAESTFVLLTAEDQGFVRSPTALSEAGGAVQKAFESRLSHCFARAPERLIAYLIPYPKPVLRNVPAEDIPDRFLVYTPPSPHLTIPADGKEGFTYKVHRKWHSSVQRSKMSGAKALSWKGANARLVRGTDWIMNQTKTSSIEFLTRIQDMERLKSDAAIEMEIKSDEDCAMKLKKTTHKGADRLQEMVLMYPSSMSKDEDQIREEFIRTMLQYRTQAQQQAVIATSLLPVTLAIDAAIMIFAPISVFFEFNAVWTYHSVRGAKAGRSVTRRMTEELETADGQQDSIKLTLKCSQRTQVLERYLAAQCHARNKKLFPECPDSPSEDEVVAAMGWSAVGSCSEDSTSKSGDTESTWEDVQMKLDLKTVMTKASREWVRTCKWTRKAPAKAEKAEKAVLTKALREWVTRCRRTENASAKAEKAAKNVA